MLPGRASAWLNVIVWRAQRAAGGHPLEIGRDEIWTLRVFALDGAQVTAGAILLVAINHVLGQSDDSGACVEGLVDKLL